ncbi:hypothetical protein RUM43_006584 [Polyplax serrata]|uniref:Uncharacterized protein n=1 Tax=Polyplax serrata TaxID=468196 RepID=A0AAN8S5J5_POLSC
MLSRVFLESTKWRKRNEKPGGWESARGGECVCVCVCVSELGGEELTHAAHIYLTDETESSFRLEGSEVIRYRGLQREFTKPGNRIPILLCTSFEEMRKKGGRIEEMR